jgi:RNA polymerase sigma-70 factor (ECF subfamily)
MPDAPDDWTVWLREHGAALLLFARQWVPGPADAEDVVQEAFVRFWRSRDQAADPAAYLYTCTKRCALEWLRGRRRRRRREEAVARPEVATGEPLFATALEQDERRAAVETALRRLPDSQHEVLILRVWGELSFPQIAATLDIPTNTAASRYRYALARLREELAEEPIP